MASTPLAPTVHSATTAHTPRSARRFFATVFAAAFALLSLWTFASPQLSSPDEPAHIIRAAAVVRGELVGEPVAAVNAYTTVRVPAYITPLDALCFAGDQTESAACQIGKWPESTELESMASSATSNNPLYYALVGLPTLVLDNEPALYGVRLLSAALVAALIAVTLTALRRFSMTQVPVLAAAVALTPTALFLGGTANPNAVEMMAAGALLSTGLLLTRTALTGRELVWWSSAAAASGVLLLSGRTIALLWLAIVFALIVIMAGWRGFLAALRQRPVWIAIAVIGLAVIGMLVWTRVTVPAVLPLAGFEDRSPAVVFLTQFDLGVGGIGAWIGAFGWLDYLAPDGVVFLWHIAIGGTALLAFALGNARSRVALGLAYLAVLFIPPIVQAVLYPSVGWMWQGRYLLAIYFCTMILAGVIIDERGRDWQLDAWTRRILPWGAGLLAFGQLAAFAHVLRRYVVGADKGWIDMFRDPQWQPPGGWIVLTLAYAAVLATIVIMASTKSRVTPSTAPADTVRSRS